MVCLLQLISGVVFHCKSMKDCESSFAVETWQNQKDR